MVLTGAKSTCITTLVMLFQVLLNCACNSSFNRVIICVACFLISIFINNHTCSVLLINLCFVITVVSLGALVLTFICTFI